MQAMTPIKRSCDKRSKLKKQTINHAITARQAYIDILTELVKEEAPTLYLEDYLIILIKRSVSI
jgi:hypothetical protein